MITLDVLGMKNMKVANIIILLLFNVSVFCQNTPSVTDSITVKGVTTKFKNKYETDVIDFVDIHVYQHNTLYTSYKSNEEGYFEFNIPKNTSIVLAIEKDDYISKRIVFDTRANATSKKINPFDIEIVMLKYFKGIDYNDLDFPITRVEYDPEIKDFNYVAKYTEMMLRKQEKILMKMTRKSNQF